MVKKIKIVFIIILLIILIISFSSSYTSLNIDNLAFVIAMGIDVGEKNLMKVTFQFTKPTAPSESGSSDENPTFINTVEASSIDNAINIMNAFLAKELNLSHCKLIIFSEEFAYKGVEKEIYSLENNTQIRPSANIVVSKCDAKSYIENSKPSIETLTTQYYEIFPSSGRYTGYTYNMTLSKFMNNLVCDSCEPFAILGGASNSQNSNSNNSNSNEAISGNIKSGSSNISGKRESENIGLAVFKDDVLVGELNSNETICLCVIINAVDGFLISVPDPDDITDFIDIYITPKNKTKTKVDISSSSPYIDLTINFEGSIYSMKPDRNYLDENKLEELSLYANKYLEDMFTNYLYKTSKEFKSDINGFGKSAFKKFATVSDMKKYNWLDSYQDAFFNLNFKTNIKSAKLLTET